MWQWLDERSMNGQQRIEEVGKLNAIGFGDEAQHRPIDIKGPQTFSLYQFKLRLIVSVKQGILDFPVTAPIDDSHGIRTAPLNINNRHELLRHNAANLNTAL
jgi:hypothetical protein